MSVNHTVYIFAPFADAVEMIKMADVKAYKNEPWLLTDVEVKFDVL